MSPVVHSLLKLERFTICVLWRICAKQDICLCRCRSFNPESTLNLCWSHGLQMNFTENETQHLSFLFVRKAAIRNRLKVRAKKTHLQLAMQSIFRYPTECYKHLDQISFIPVEGLPAVLNRLPSGQMRLFKPETHLTILVERFVITPLVVFKLKMILSESCCTQHSWGNALMMMMWTLLHFVCAVPISFPPHSTGCRIDHSWNPREAHILHPNWFIWKSIMRLVTFWPKQKLAHSADTDLGVKRQE